jgi:AraC-like DNA-binding protein
MEYKEFKPCRELSGFVECYWIAHSEKPPFRETESLIPDGTIELMFNFGDNYSQIADGERKEIKGSHVIGIRKRSLHISQTHKQDILSVRFKPGGIHPFTRVPVIDFANGFYEFDQFLGKEYRELESKLYEARNTERRIAIIENHLLNKLRETDIFDYRFVNSCSKLLMKTPNFSIKDLSAYCNTNYKTMERKFLRVMGLTPSEFLKIKRFNKAVLSMYSCKYSLTEIAYQCNYYDQSHFIRDFKQLTSYSPQEFIREQFTIVQVIQPALAERMSKSYNF